MPGRRSVQQLDAAVARASSPQICADCTGATADLRAAAHLSGMRAGPEAAHQPQPAVHLVTAAHPREPERAAAAGRTQPGTSSHRRHGAVLRSQIHQAGEGSVRVSREDEAETGERDQPSRSEVPRGRAGGGLRETERRRSELCSNRKDVGGGRSAPDALSWLPTACAQPRAPPRCPRRQTRLSVTAEGSELPSRTSCQSKPSKRSIDLDLSSFGFDTCF